MAQPNTSARQAIVLAVVLSVLVLVPVVAMIWAVSTYTSPEDNRFTKLHNPVKPRETAGDRARKAAKAEATAARKAAIEKEFSRCRDLLKLSQKAQVLHNMSFDGGRPKVWIGRTWYRIPIESKTEFAQTAACFFLGGEQAKFITFPIYDGMTGRQIATWQFNRLDVE